MRSLFTLVALAICTTFLAAQTSIGLRGAYGFSGLRTDADLDLISDQLDNASALSVGLYLEQAFSPVFSLRSGVELNRRGTVLNLNQDANVFGSQIRFAARAQTRFTYLDVPVLAQVYLPTNSRAKPYAFGGASLGYAVKGNVRTRATALVEFDLATSNIDLDAIDYERFHAAAIAGIGVKAQMSDILSLFAEGRFEQSLTQPYDVPILTARTGFKGMNFGAGVAITL